MKNKPMKLQNLPNNATTHRCINMGNSVSRSIMEFIDKAPNPCNSKNHLDRIIEIPIVTLQVTQPEKSNAKELESDDHEDQLAISLANYRLAKYRHDNGLPPLPEYPWFDSLMKMAIANGVPNMFVPTPYQLKILIASNGTKISYQNQ